MQRREVLLGTLARRAIAEVVYDNDCSSSSARFRRICLFDTLLPVMTNEEITAVVGHEIGHDRLHHVKLGLVMGARSCGACRRMVPASSSWLQDAVSSSSWCLQRSRRGLRDPPPQGSPSSCWSCTCCSR